ncbi:unnamed protein product [Rhizophagus irregularis]|uniref:F-box domain-containing protein n=1 Tax=Rhizophagus irregularis TaxID=588596 RepID=A0A916E675_9GLOM|nr:hypothetical protein OCT59_027885 [Rhizophagus irregularis]CAB4386296.1 unnamed protein product [Rhizophagus irregularis]CAB4437004.1 unnamed protein product [Rhizophagus irregularis]CAB4437174.1 unnamed protein product [Rhizophagus irregularis]CAB5362675.1 unnamed protein product [Rhizophagus irregularis]
MMSIIIKYKIRDGKRLFVVIFIKDKNCTCTSSVMTDQHPFKRTTDVNKSKEVHYSPYLPPETLGEIFSFFADDDVKSLHSCLLVNKTWCESAAFILWKRPFDISSIMASSELTSFELFIVSEICRF